MNEEEKKAIDYYKNEISLAKTLDEVIINGRIEPFMSELSEEEIINDIQELWLDALLVNDLDKIICNNDKYRTAIQGLLDLYNKEKEKNKGLIDNSNKLIEVTNLYLDSVPKSKIRELLKELKQEYSKNEETFNKHFEKETRDIQDYYMQKEATTIMQEISWLEGKLQELLEE